jgi:hypothetical protein
LNALMCNELSSHSVLYVYCDGAKANASDESLHKVSQVREIVKSKSWCKEVHIIEARVNKGLALSIKTGVSEIVEKHGKVIVLEDDLVTSPFFLTYMNQALDYYDKLKSVFSISGYCLPPNKFIIPDDYHFDVFVCLRNSSWGWATWSDRWTQIDWEVKAYRSLKGDKSMREAFARMGDDVYPMLEAQQAGRLNIWSIQFTMAHFVNHAVSIVPTKSYVDNLGLDGTGENCSLDQFLRNNELNTKSDIRFLDILYEDKSIINSFYNVNCNSRRSIFKKIINKLSRIISGKSVFVIKKKVFN